MMKKHIGCQLPIMLLVALALLANLSNNLVSAFQPIDNNQHHHHFSFSSVHQGLREKRLTVRPLELFGSSGNGGGSGGGSGVSSIPSSLADRDKQAIEAVKAAISNPKTPSFPLIECEFPPLQELNKLGDGSLRSAKLVDDANLAFCAKLVRGLAPLPFLGGPKVRVFTSTAATSSFISNASKTIKGAASISSLRAGSSDNNNEITAGDICIIPSPSSRQDYLAAEQLASGGVVGAVVLINGLAKDQKSVKGEATMAYYLKPLTYNSQVVGYLARKYPSKWAAIDLLSKTVLGSFTDSEILFQKTNTPDLRAPGRLVQKCVDERAIQARKNK